MNRLRFHLPILGALLLVAFAHGQSTFQNLDFEAAVLTPVPSDPQGAVQFSSALPGWVGFINGELQTTTIPNGVPIGLPGQTPFIAIMTPPGWSGWQGSYAVGFGAATDGTNFIPVALAQSGVVPPQAKSLQFLALYAPTVFLNGQSLPSISIGAGPSVSTLFGVDVSAFAGQFVDLQFQPGLGINYLDDIVFSPEAIPEPGVLALLTFGALLLGLRKIARKK